MYIVHTHTYTHIQPNQPATDVVGEKLKQKKLSHCTVDQKEVIGEEGLFYLRNKIRLCSGDDELRHALVAPSQALTGNSNAPVRGKTL